MNNNFSLRLKRVKKKLKIKLQGCTYGTYMYYSMVTGQQDRQR